MTSFLKEYAFEQFSKVLSWSPESKKILKLSNIVDWCIDVPNCSTLRVNTLCSSSEECILYLREEFAKKLSYGNIQMPEIKIHDRIPECVVISALNTNHLDLSLKTSEVLVDAICGAAVLRGSNVYAPGVMGMLPTTQIGSEVSIFSDLTGTCLKGYKQIFDNEGKLFLGNGVALKSRGDLFDGDPIKKGLAIELRYPVSGLLMPIIPQKFGILQNLPSIVCSRVLDPQPGDIILDMCAAPGNKTTHIATLMKDEGTLVAIDRKSKIGAIAASCASHNVRNCIKIFAGNSTNIVTDSERAVDAGPPFSANTFDKVLLDAACSGTGLRPMLENKVQSEARVHSFSHQQKKFMDNAVRLLKSGGTLVYSTCSILCEENECLVAWTLKQYPEMTLVHSNPIVGGPGLPECGLNEEQRLMVQRFGMNENEDSVESIGFFIAKFIKK